MSKKIIIKINAAGQVTTEAVGFVGGACAKALDPIQKAFGGVQITNNKPEFNALEMTSDQTQQMTA